MYRNLLQRRSLLGKLYLIQWLQFFIILSFGYFLLKKVATHIKSSMNACMYVCMYVYVFEYIQTAIVCRVNAIAPPCGQKEMKYQSSFLFQANISQVEFLRRLSLRGRLVCKGLLGVLLGMISRREGSRTGQREKLNFRGQSCYGKLQRRDDP